VNEVRRGSDVQVNEAMIRNHIHPNDMPLFSIDLEICQQVFDVVRSETGVERGSSKSDLIASHIIHAYKQGIREPAQLLIMARTAPIAIT
jgi:hypothetical protein